MSFPALRPRPASGASRTLESDSRPGASPNLYGKWFWLGYASNTILSVSFAILFRYADFVTVAGGTEVELGWIVGIGMIGSLATRLLLGSSIDRYGARPIWIACLALYAATCFVHLAITSCTGIPVYLVRILFCCAFAGAVGASYTFACQQGPPKRMAEMYGVLGTASMVGYFTGTQLGDFTLGLMEVSRTSVDLMFLLGGGLGLVAIPFAWFATRGETPPKPVAQPPLLELLRRYHPSLALLAVDAGMGLIFGILTAFLRSYAAELGIARIGLFFSVGAVVLVGTRFPTRRWPERYGNRAVILLGVATMVVSQFCFLLVSREWHLILPAAVFSCAQAILFPAMSAEGTLPFPARNRGVGVTLMLAVADVGLLVGSPLAGMLLVLSERVGWPPYSVLFTALALVMAATGLWYAWSSRPQRR